MFLDVQKASMYLRNLDFNLGNGTVRRRLLDLLRLLSSSIRWVKGSSILSEESRVNRGILFKKLGWKSFLYFSGYYGYGFGHYGTYQVLAAESFPRTTTSFGMTTTTTPYTTTTSYIYTTTYGQRQGMSYSVTNKSPMYT